MDEMGFIFMLIEFILVPAYIALYIKSERTAKGLNEIEKQLQQEVSELRTSIAKDFVTKVDMNASLAPLFAAIDKLETKFDTGFNKLSDLLLDIYKKEV